MRDRMFTSVFFKATFSRVLYEQIVFPLLVIRFRASCMFCAFEIVPLLCQVPVLLGIRNPSPINKSSSWESSRYLRSIRSILQKYAVSVSTRKATLVFFPSQFASNSIGDKLRVPAFKRRVVYHGVDRSYWGQEIIEGHSILKKYSLSSKRFFLFTSMLYPYKGAHILINAYARAYEFFRSERIKLVIVGGIADEKYFNRLKTLSRSLCVDSEDITFLGFLPKEELRVLYKTALCFVLPTTLETFGQPFLEAMASGLPIVTTNIDVAREICDDAALYFEGNDAVELSGTLRVLLTDDYLQKGLTFNALRRVMNFSWEKEVLETFDLLYELV